MILNKIKHKILKLHVLLFAKAKYKRFNILLLDLGLKGLGVTNFDRNFNITGETHLFKKLMKLNPKIIFDVGANKGEYTKKLIKYCPNSQYYCFEPNKNTFKKLKHSLDKHNNINLYNLGLGEKEALDFLYSPTNDINSTLSSNNNIFNDSIKQEVKNTTIDNFLHDNNINQIDFLKIDTEGTEFNILKGAINTIKNQKVNIIQFEFNHMNRFSKTFMKDFIKILEDYTLFRLLPNSFLELDSHNYKPVHLELFGYQNILAIKKDFYEQRFK
jgi:FkbM family methyltransferase